MESEGVGVGKAGRGDSPLSSSSTHCRDDVADGQHQHASAAINRLISEQKTVFERLLQQSCVDAVDKSAVCAKFVQSLQACQIAVCLPAPCYLIKFGALALSRLLSAGHSVLLAGGRSAQAEKL